jgi:hypothetical protein
MGARSHLPRGDAHFDTVVMIRSPLHGGTSTAPPPEDDDWDAETEVTSIRFPLRYADPCAPPTGNQSFAFAPVVEPTQETRLPQRLLDRVGGWLPIWAGVVMGLGIATLVLKFL